MSIRKYKASEIAEILEVDYDTVLGWINRWESTGLSGVLNNSKNGRRPIFDAQEKK